MRPINFTLLTILACMSCALSGQGQVTVEVTLGQDQFLRNESLPVRVRVTNRSGQTLNLGQDYRWLSFAVTKRDGSVATRLGQVPVAKPFSLPSSQTKDLIFDLMPYYHLEPGRYRVLVSLLVSSWNSQFSSKAEDFEVVKGVKVWEQTVGLPQAEGNSGPPSLRRYVLLQARYLKHMYLYARVTGDTDNKVYRVFPLGEVINFIPTEYRIDPQSRLHVLFQDGSRSFNYSVVDPNGRLIKRQRHDYFESRPSLRRGEDGGVKVVGGIRRLVSTDYPPASLPEQTNEVQKPSP